MTATRAYPCASCPEPASRPSQQQDAHPSAPYPGYAQDQTKECAAPTHQPRRSHNHLRDIEPGRRVPRLILIHTNANLAAHQARIHRLDPLHHIITTNSRSAMREMNMRHHRSHASNTAHVILPRIGAIILRLSATLIHDNRLGRRNVPPLILHRRTNGGTPHTHRVLHQGFRVHATERNSLRNLRREVVHTRPHSGYHG